MKLASLVLFVALFVCLNNLVFPVRVPVGVFYLNMSKKGKKQDGTISPFLFAINNRKSCSKRHLKILSCSILTFVRVNQSVNLVKGP